MNKNEVSINGDKNKQFYKKCDKTRCQIMIANYDMLDLV